MTLTKEQFTSLKLRCNGLTSKCEVAMRNKQSTAFIDKLTLEYESICDCIERENLYREFNNYIVEFSIIYRNVKSKYN